MKNILLVEDDQALGSEVFRSLEESQYKVEWAKTLKEATEVFAPNIDLIILDWELPDGEGSTWLLQLRKKQILTPVIMLTARTEVHDRVLGLDMGASDYITKPFEYVELLARIRSQLKENIASFKGTHIVEFDDLFLDTEDKTLEIAEDKISLAPLEYELLHFLIKRPESVFTKEELIKAVWKKSAKKDTRAIDNVVLTLRKKIGAERIETIRGVGYRLNRLEKIS